MDVRCPRRNCSSTAGTQHPSPIRPWSRYVSITCGGRSTRRSVHAASRQYEDRGTALIRVVHNRSLRLRLTALAALVITATILAGFAVLAITLVVSVRANVNTTVSAYADSVAHSGTGGTWPEPL